MSKKLQSASSYLNKIRKYKEIQYNERKHKTYIENWFKIKVFINYISNMTKSEYK